MFMSSLKGRYTKNGCEKQYLYPLKLLCLKIGICNIELPLLFEPVVRISNMSSTEIILMEVDILFFSNAIKSEGY